MVNALEITDATAQVIKDAKGFNRKLQGKKALTNASPIDQNTPAPTTISTIQLSYDQQIQHLAGLTSILISEPSYAPNETELATATLTTLQANLTTKNNEVATAYANISNSRIARNNTLYGPHTGLVEIATEVKKYIKSLFGASSPQFAQVKGIEFKKAKN